MSITSAVEPATPVRRNPARVVFELLVPPLAPSAGRRVVEVLGFGLGSALCLSWLRSIAGDLALLVAGMTMAGIYFGASAARSHALRRLLAGLLIAAYVAFAYMAGTLSSVLAWALPVWVGALAVGALALVLAGAFTNLRPPRFALCLPLGIGIAGLLAGWLRDDGRIRCDDYLRAVSDPAIRVAIPTNTELLRCKPGEALVVGRYPRRIWQSPEGSELLFTTQAGILGFLPTGKQVTEELPGSICSAPLDGSRRPQCLGTGKAQAIAESERHDRLFVGSWGHFDDGARGIVYAVTRSSPLRLLGELRMPEQTGELFYDHETDVLGLFSDEGEVMIPVRAANLEPMEPVPAPIIPGITHYDQQRKEGVFCFAAGPLKPIDGEAYVSVAFRGAPFSYRALAPSTRFPSSWLALTWGCDWDPEARRVYVAVSNFGLLFSIDYDSGAVLDRSWVGFGVRSVALDPARRRLYFANFLRGDVTEWDLASSRALRSWFTGRFVRDIRLSRDGASLLASSNLGVVEIRL